jgi:hypothetical protein
MMYQLVAQRSRQRRESTPIRKLLPLSDRVCP